MICKHCGNNISSNLNICSYCGMPNPYYGHISFGFKFISCIFPLVGICLFLMLKFRRNPNSNSIFIWTLSGILLWAVLYSLAFFAGILLAFYI